MHRWFVRVACIASLAAPLGCADDSAQKSDAEASEAGSAADAQSGAGDASQPADSSTTSDAGSTSADAGPDAGATTPDASADASSGSDASAGKISCDHRKVICRIAEPNCPANQVPSVENGCFGPCVVIDQCSCAEAAECPHEEMYVCHRSAKHCGPYVN